MANGFESQKINRTSIDDLLKLVQGLGQMGAQQRERKSKGFMSMYDEFDVSASSYSNEKIDYAKQRFDSYFSENRDNMDDQTLDMFLSLNDKFDYQKKLNTEYNMHMNRHQSQSDDIIRLTNEFNQVNNTTDFTYNTVSYNNLRKRIETPTTVKAPTREDFGFSDWDSWDYKMVDGEKVRDKAKENEYIKALDEYNATISQHRENYKFSIGQEIEREISKYVTDKKNFLQKFSNRSGNPAFAYDFQTLQNTESIYNFALQSARDDGIFDEEEKNAYMTSIGTGDIGHIDNFKIRDKQVSTAVANQLSTSIQENFEIGEKLHDDLDILRDIQMSDTTDPKWALKSNTASGIQLPIGDSIQSYTFQEVKDVINKRDPNDPLFQYFNNMGSEISEIERNLKELDKSFVDNSGTSLLNKMKSTNKNWDTKTKIIDSFQIGDKIEYSKEGGVLSDIKKPEDTIESTPLINVEEVTKDIKNEDFKKVAKIRANRINDISISQDSLRAELKELQTNNVVIGYEEDLKVVEQLESDIKELSSYKRGTRWGADRKEIRNIIKEKKKELRILKEKLARYVEPRLSPDDVDIYARRKILQKPGEAELFTDEVRPSLGMYTTQESIISSYIKNKRHIQSELDKLMKEKKSLQTQLGQLRTK